MFSKSGNTNQQNTSAAAQPGASWGAPPAANQAAMQPLGSMQGNNSFMPNQSAQQPPMAQQQPPAYANMSMEDKRAILRHHRNMGNPVFQRQSQMANALRNQSMQQAQMQQQGMQQPRGPIGANMIQNSMDAPLGTYGPNTAQPTADPNLAKQQQYHQLQQQAQQQQARQQQPGAGSGIGSGGFQP